MSRLLFVRISILKRTGDVDDPGRVDLEDLGDLLGREDLFSKKAFDIFLASLLESHFL